MKVELACADQGDTGTEPAAAWAQGSELQMVKLPAGAICYTHLMAGERTRTSPGRNYSMKH